MEPEKFIDRIIKICCAFNFECQDEYSPVTFLSQNNSFIGMVYDLCKEFYPDITLNIVTGYINRSLQ